MARVWYPDEHGVVHAVITEDDGFIWTVQPNTAAQAANEAARARPAGGVQVEIRIVNCFSSPVIGHRDDA